MTRNISTGSSVVWALAPVFCVLHLERCSCVLFGTWLVSWLLPKPHLMPSIWISRKSHMEGPRLFPFLFKGVISSEDLYYLREEQKPAKAVEFSLAYNQIWPYRKKRFKLMLHSSFLSLQLIKM